MEESIIVKTEKWKDICGYEGIYQVSNLGRIKRLETNTCYGKGNYYRAEHLVSVNERGNGYLRCHLSKNGKTKCFNVHRLVAIAFIENPTNLPTVNHIDEDKTDNRDWNLEWATMSYQNQYGVGAINRNKAKEMPIMQMDMDDNYIKTWNSIKEVSEALNLNPSTVVCVCKNKRRYKSTGGYKFKYMEDMNI